MENLQPLCERCNSDKQAWFATYDEHADQIRQAAHHDDPYNGSVKLLKAFDCNWAPSELIKMVASIQQYQDDWAKRLREIRNLGWVIPSRRQLNRIQGVLFHGAGLSTGNPGRPDQSGLRLDELRMKDGTPKGFVMSESQSLEEGSWASSASRRRNMQAIRSRDTKPEREVRRLVHAQGLRYRVCARPLPDLRRTADMVFRPAKVAVFIDGCYWHGCPQHYVAPRTNSGYWSDKVRRNVNRDQDTDSRLAEAGWTVLRFWEHESPDACALQIAATVSRLRPQRG